jgi:hypothetical protein
MVWMLISAILFVSSGGTETSRGRVPTAPPGEDTPYTLDDGPG